MSLPADGSAGRGPFQQFRLPTFLRKSVGKYEGQKVTVDTLKIHFLIQSLT